jgi:hypothetical protein
VEWYIGTSAKLLVDKKLTPGNPNPIKLTVKRSICNLVAIIICEQRRSKNLWAVAIIHDPDVIKNRDQDILTHIAAFP